ncbi:MAG: yhdE [Rickettsiales bacterium]|jgi:septum formation protein|nr:yhdE [Rickettsiales bacterium]
MQLILASASPRRLSLLKQIGLNPHAVVPAEIDETPQKKELPRVYAERLAKEKATAVALRNTHPSDTVILAADTVVAVGRRILPKAEILAQARECLKLLSGKRHHVYTGIALIHGGKLLSRVVESTVKFKRLTTQEIDAYLASGEWEGKAGGYAIQGMAESYIPFIQGSYSNIVGLPLHETYQILQGIGYVR